MSTPSYQPRSYAKQPKLFGTESIMEWKPAPANASGATLDQMAAAKRQHLICIAIHEAISKKASSLASYVGAYHEIEYSRFSSVLRGEAVMKLVDVANAERMLGLSIWNNPDLWNGFRP